MRGTAPRQFDLYDFFSVLLPGSALLLGLAPFLPRETDIGSLGAILPLLIGGFVVGRAIHSIAVTIENPPSETESERGVIRTLFISKPLGWFFGREYFDDVTHRDRFISELKRPDVVDESLVDEFYQECRRVFPNLELPEDRSQLDDSEQVFDTLYGLVRAYVHIDARGRSRTFQAIYAFYRSMWIVSFLLFLVYLVYGVLKVLGLNPGIVDYTSFIGSLGVPDSLIVLGSLVVAYAGYLAFSEARTDYRRFFVQYLISDFVLLHRTRAAVADETNDSDE